MSDTEDKRTQALRKRTEALLAQNPGGLEHTDLENVTELAHELAHANERLAHVRQVLLAIRNVNQLIVSEDDPRRLIEKACENLTETLGYHTAWIALVNAEGDAATMTAASGFDGGFSEMRRQFERGEFSACMREALGSREIVLVEDISTGCPDCPVASDYAGRVAMSYRLEFGGTVYGVLAVSVPPAFARDEEEHELFREVAGDLAFALHKIEESAQARAHLAQYESILGTTADGYWRVDAAGRLLEVNANYCRMSGYPREELLALHIADLDVNETPDQVRERMRKIIETGGARFETQHRTKDGRVIDVEVSTTYCGETNEFVVFVRDLGERKRAEETERFLTLVLGQIQDRVTVTTLDGHITFANDAECEMMGYTREQLVGQHISVYGEDPEAGATQEEILRETLRTGFWRGEIVNYRADGRAITLDCRTTAVRDSRGEPVALCGIATDITEQKRAEQALRTSEERVRRKLRAIMEPEGDIGTLALADIIDQQALRSLMERFYEATGVGSAMVDLSGEVLVAIGWQDVCTKYHRVHPATLANCLESDLELSTGVAPGSFKAYRCKNNLLDFVTPITVGGRHVGNIFIGQFFFEGEAIDLDLFRRQAREYGFDEAEYLAAVERVPRFSREKAEAAMAFFAEFAELVSSLSYGSIRLSRALEQNEAAMRQLRTSEEKYRELVQTAYSVILKFDTAGRLTFFNEYAQQLFGYTEEEVLGRPILGTIVPEAESSGRDLAEMVEGICRDPEHFCDNQNENITKDGRRLWMRWNNRAVLDADGRLTGILSVGNDETDRKRAEEALKARESLLQKTFDVLPVGLWFADKDGRLLRGNPAGVRIWGAEPQVGPDEYGIFKARRLPSGVELAPDEWSLVRTIREGVTVLDEWLEIDAFDGQKRVILNSTAPVLDEDGNIQGAIVMNQDMTDFTRVTTERERLLQAIEQAGEIVVITDTAAAIQYVNPAFETVTGYSRGEAIGQNPRILKSGEQDQAFYEDLWHTITSGKTWQGQMVNRRKDGTLYTEEATISPVRDASGVIVNYVAVKRDITHDIELEDQYRQSQKLEAVGRLAGGVAHDFNNMLTIILGQVEMALLDLDPQTPLHAMLREVEKAGEQSANLTRQLLAFARKQTVDPKVLDINETISSMLKMLDRLIGEDIDLAWLPGHALWPARMDPAQLDQILANLVVNARDAIEGVGKITIETETVLVEESYCEEHPTFEPGRYITLSVSDNGCGMDRATVQSIFEPFFTTKAPGVGTGLGLATVYGIVRQNSGFINVYSEPGLGTTFRIYLPACEDSQPDAGLDGPKAELPHGTETILLVEDASTLLDVARAQLQKLGYTVLPAQTPAEAHRWIEDCAQTVHLLLTDVVMPEMNGRDLWDALRRLRPGLPCLFMSGYTANVIAHHGVLDADVHFLQKPFSLESLAVKVREALGNG